MQRNIYISNLNSVFDTAMFNLKKKGLYQPANNFEFDNNLP